MTNSKSQAKSRGASRQVELLVRLRPDGTLRALHDTNYSPKFAANSSQWLSPQYLYKNYQKLDYKNPFTYVLIVLSLLLSVFGFVGIIVGGALAYIAEKKQYDETGENAENYEQIGQYIFFN